MADNTEIGLPNYKIDAYGTDAGGYRSVTVQLHVFVEGDASTPGPTEDDVADGLRDSLAGHAAIDTVTLKKREITETTL